MTLTILLHSSKTMVVTPPRRELTRPHFEAKADALAHKVAALPVAALAKGMRISTTLAERVAALYGERNELAVSAAVDVFRGDIYSGLRSLEWSEHDAAFAQQHLLILSGLYGVLRPYDAIRPYRLEAAYKLPKVGSIYVYWGEHIVPMIPKEGPVINVTSAEYAKFVLPYIDTRRVVTPRFLSRMPGKEDPVFVVVHAKIARGAFARWLIQRGRDDADDLQEFDDLGYRYEPSLSTPEEPVYICDDFQGIGLSQRLV